MIIGTIWQRYFLKKQLKILFFILFIFYALYILLDYTHRVHYFSHYQGFNHFLIVIIQYYLSDFIRRLDVLLPFALLISTIATLSSLTMNRELLALLTNGVRMRLLLTPFLLVGLIGVLLTYANEQLGLPPALKKIRMVEEARISKKHHRNQQAFVQLVILKDGSRLLFSSFNHQTQNFEDLIWIHSFDQLWRMKYLSIEKPHGHWVEKIGQDLYGHWRVLQQFEQRDFPEIAFNKKILLETIIPVEEMTLTALWKKLPRYHKEMSERESEIMTLFHQKMALPWLSLIAVLAPAPFCIRFSRRYPLFMIYSCAIFGLLAFYLLINAAAILGMRQLIPPYWAIWIPFLCLVGLLSPAIGKLIPNARNKITK